MASTTNLTIDQGASFSKELTVENSDGTAFDLTGYSAERKDGFRLCVNKNKNKFNNNN